MNDLGRHLHYYSQLSLCPLDLYSDMVVLILLFLSCTFCNSIEHYGGAVAKCNFFFIVHVNPPLTPLRVGDASAQGSLFENVLLLHEPFIRRSKHPLPAEAERNGRLLNYKEPGTSPP